MALAGYPRKYQGSTTPDIVTEKSQKPDTSRPQTYVAAGLLREHRGVAVHVQP